MMRRRRAIGTQTSMTLDARVRWHPCGDPQKFKECLM